MPPGNVDFFAGRNGGDAGTECQILGNRPRPVRNRDIDLRISGWRARLSDRRVLGEE
jgi:hypothetical protein